ncbi:DinB family protein [Winogradskyella ursingii]|uniref:DinB family protein n=1 Tax=Winogradskyella ursingii TaxID=2686079 RepID=UPI0015CBF428|nr:DinB family protein [Winogradskyella ursingii]
MISEQLSNDEYNQYYKMYIDKASNKDIIVGLQKNLESVMSFYSNIPVAKHEFSYAAGKWTVKEILLHIIDTERIFSYRALRIARGDTTPMPGFNQDSYVDHYEIKRRTMEDLLKEYKAVRQATIALFSHISESRLKLIGEASGSPISPRAIGYIITGHENHHNDVIRERYL